MSDGTEKKEEFNSAGEAISYISLDQAVLKARKLARQDEDRYRERLGWQEIVWAEAGAEQREDSYRIVLQFKPPAPGLREQQMGEEEFIFGLTGGLEERQVLFWPTDVHGGSASASASAPNPIAPIKETARPGHSGFPEPMTWWAPLPILKFRLIARLLRRLRERVLDRDSRL